MLVEPVLAKILMQRSVKLVRELSRRRANYEQTREMFNLQLHPATFDNERTHRQAYYSGRVLGGIIERQIYESVMASRRSVSAKLDDQKRIGSFSLSTFSGISTRAKRSTLRPEAGYSFSARR